MNRSDRSPATLLPPQVTPGAPETSETAPPAINRRQFALAAASLSTATLLTGCHSHPQQPARDATLLHNRAIREAVGELEQTMNNIDEHMGQFNAENWQDALANLQTSVIRLHNSVDELKHALGYRES